MKLTYFLPRNPLPPQHLDDRKYGEAHCMQTVPAGTFDLDLHGLMQACQAAARVGRKGDAGYITATEVLHGQTRKQGGPAEFVLIDQDGAEPDWAALDEYQGFAWTTASHRPDKPSWRVVIPLAAPMRHGQLRCPFRGGFIRNRTQPAFLPTHRVDVAAIGWRVLHGERALDASELGSEAKVYGSGEHGLHEDSMLGAAFRAAGWIVGEQSDGWLVRCPWVHLHSDGEPGGSVVFHDDGEGDSHGKFFCSRTECRKANGGRGWFSSQALEQLRASAEVGAAVAAELAHWTNGLEGWVRWDVPPAQPAAAPSASPALTAPPPGAPTAPPWSLLEGSLMGAPASVERALRQYRAQWRTPDARPDLANSGAVLKWLVAEKGWAPHHAAAELGPEAGIVAARLTAPEVQSVGRLTQIDQWFASTGVELRWNEMALAIEANGEPWTDNHTAAARLALEQAGISAPDKPLPNGDIEQRARALAAPYHPVAEYLAALPTWDGVPRVDGLWLTYFGATDTPLNRKLGACFAIGAVRRVLEPGCKLDMMPILLGEQGAQKSSGLSALVGGPPFFSDAAPNFSHRAENVMTITGCWVWEVAELQGLDRADQNAVKAFVTRQEDHVLLPYARIKERLRRRSVSIGTTNDRTCLSDPTGSRRHPVIEIGGIDRGALVRDRDQLWAEALHRCRAGEPHWLDKVDEAEMVARNEQHTATNQNELAFAVLEDWFAKPMAERMPFVKNPQDFSMQDVQRFAFGDMRVDQRRIGAALAEMGCKFRRVGAAKVRRYLWPDEDE